MTAPLDKKPTTTGEIAGYKGGPASKLNPPECSRCRRLMMRDAASIFAGDVSAAAWACPDARCVPSVVEPQREHEECGTDEEVEGVGQVFDKPHEKTTNLPADHFVEVTLRSGGRYNVGPMTGPEAFGWARDRRDELGVQDATPSKLWEPSGFLSRHTLGGH